MSSVISLETIPTDIIWRVSVENYHAMIEAGILTDGDPIELLEGYIILKMSKNPPHRVVTHLLRTELEKLVSLGWYIDSQEPITLSDSEPEPDVVIVRGNTRDYLSSHPVAKDIALVIEVADATLSRDRIWKKRIYARALIPIYWIINLVEEQIEVYTQPSEEDYRHRQDYRRSESVPVIIEGVEIGKLPVDILLP